VQEPGFYPSTNKKKKKTKKKKCKLKANMGQCKPKERGFKQGFKELQGERL
jgi:hypothetical protein